MAGIVIFTAVFFIALIIRLFHLNHASVPVIADEHAHVVDLEIKAVDLQTQVLQQRVLKHDSVNMNHLLVGVISLTRAAADECHCEDMARLIPLMDQVLERAAAQDSQSNETGWTN